MPRMVGGCDRSCARVRRLPSFKHRHFSSAHVAATHSRPDELEVKEWRWKGCRVIQNSTAMCEVSQSDIQKFPLRRRLLLPYR
jgi:hypothetical protein